jgi:nitrogen fixation-related uncharacterized protein
MDKPETKANEEWTSQRQRQMKYGQLPCPFFICLCLWLAHSSFAFFSDLSILHLPLSLACPFLICLCLWFVHSSFAFVSGLSILHLPLSLTCPFFICLCLWLVLSSFAFVSGLSILHWQMKNGQARDKGK